MVMTLHATPSSENPVQWSLVTSSFRVLAADPLSSFKTLNKLTHVMARVEAAEKGADEALLINTNGEVAETAERQCLLGLRRQDLHDPDGPRRAAGHHARSRAGDLPGAGPADEQTGRQARGVEKLRRHLHHPKCVRHHTGGNFRRRARRLITPGGSNFQRVSRIAGQNLSLPFRAGPPLYAPDWKRCGRVNHRWRFYNLH